MSRSMPARRSSRAMNCDVDLVCYSHQAQRRLDRAEAWLRGFEARFSRFNPKSELSFLNAAAGQPVRVSPRLFCLVSLALSLAARSGGLFDPTVLRELEEAGYNRSFEQIAGTHRALRRQRGPRSTTWRDVQTDLDSRTIALPEGSGIDLGGIAKGWAVDRLAAIIGSPALVNAGGDLFASGRPHDAEAWLVGVEDPLQPERDLAVLAIRDRAVATSTSLRRRWFDGDRWSHHLIDPRTSEPSDSDALQVTVITESTVLADYHAKVALLSGVEDGLRYLEQTPDVEGLIVCTSGVLSTSGLGSCLVRFREDGKRSGG